MKPQLTDEDILHAAKQLDVEVAAVKAVIEVESEGHGFLLDGRPKVRFEAHKFHYWTKGKFTEKYPDLSVKTDTTKS